MTSLIETYDETRLATASNTVGHALEAGKIIYFPDCPIELPNPEDLDILRAQLPRQLNLKNVSYHPEAGRVRGLDKESPIGELVQKVLINHSDRVSEFLHSVLPGLFDNALVGTCSFRPIEEQGRNLKPHASNELIHIDAGAYGATNGDRILRFFVNVNETEDRVWASKGAFPSLLRQYGSEAGINEITANDLRKGPLDHLRTALLQSIDKLGMPVSRALDSSPYDRTMRRFHNYMKDTPGFQASTIGREEMRFPPMSAWMVLTDMVSHACLSGQHCLNYTALLPLGDCQYPKLAPFNLLAQQGTAAH